MKKILALILALSLSVSLVACTADQGDDMADDAQTSSDAADADTTEGDDADADADTTEGDDADTTEGDDAEVAEMTMDEFIAEVQAQLEPQLAALEEAGTPIEVLARDDSLVYAYTFTSDIGEIAVAKDTIDADLESNKATFDEIYAELVNAVPSAKSVIVEYYTMNNELITSREYN